jgi:hypothetical protein
LYCNFSSFLQQALSIKGIVIIFYYHPFSFQCLAHILANNSRLVIYSYYYHSAFVFVVPVVVTVALTVAVPVVPVALTVVPVALTVALTVVTVAVTVAVPVAVPVRPVVLLMFVRKLSMLIVIGIVELINYSVLKLFS